MSASSPPLTRHPTPSTTPTPYSRCAKPLLPTLARSWIRSVRSQAVGSRYFLTDRLSPTPGDERGPASTGAHLHSLPRHPFGAMAERMPIGARRSVALPASTDPVLLAAAMNPTMSSWVALRRRVTFALGQRVLILGATGRGGRTATQVAKHLGARPAGRIAEPSADTHVDLDAATAGVDLAVASQDVDVELDHLWGQRARQAMYTIVPASADDSRTSSYAQIVSVAGQDCVILTADRRATHLQVVVNGDIRLVLVP